MSDNTQNGGITCVEGFKTAISGPVVTQQVLDNFDMDIKQLINRLRVDFHSCKFDAQVGTDADGLLTGVIYITCGQKAFGMAFFPKDVVVPNYNGIRQMIVEQTLSVV